jgi:hypothetical protein
MLAPLTFDKFATSAIGWLDPKVMVFVAIDYMIHPMWMMKKIERCLA